MKFLNRIKQSFKGFAEKVRSAGKSLTHGIKQGLEKIKGVFKKEKREPVEPVDPTSAPTPLPKNYLDAIEKYIIGLQDNFAIYYRKANGQFDVYMYNVEDLKWETLDIINKMQSATKAQYEEIQSIVRKVVESTPSGKSEDDYKDMFANINAVLNGGTYIMKTLGPVSTDGTPFDGVDE